MEWTPGTVNNDVEDRRDESGGGGGGGFGFGGRGLGIGGVIIVGILSLVFRTNLFTLFQGGQQAQQVRPAPNPQLDQREATTVDFLKYTLKDIQDTWTTVLPQETQEAYRHARLVLYRDAYPSACGTAQSAIGPFYCPGDEKVYLDLGFFNELRSRFGAPGEFAEAYVVAHEIGHHVQKILGIEPKVRRLQQANPQAANALSVRLELQADCFAGVWSHATQDRSKLNSGDIESALGAAAAVGDDRLQKQARGQVNPESFTHGSSAQRTAWFKRGFDEGTVSACDTFRRSGSSGGM